MNPRLIATKIIFTILQDQTSLTEAFNRILPAKSNDIGLIKELCYGCLRWLPRLSAISQQLISKSLKSKDKDIEILIALGLYQLLYMRIPDHAAVGETVSAVKGLGKPWASGMINAVLRNFQRNQETITAKINDNSEAKYAHPLWLLKLLQQAWPNDWQMIAESNNQHPPLTLRVNLQQISRDDYLQQLAAQNITAIPTPYSLAGIILTTPIDVTKLPGFPQGSVSVQDLAAQLAAGLMDLAPGQRVLDACAAPGGKTAHMLETEPRLAEVIAIDKDEQRLARVKENLSRLNLSAKLICADAANTASWWDGQLFDRILLDAPCSATGVIRRHPDIKFLRHADDFISLPQQQLHLLKTLWPLLKPGGILLYATCSIMPSENECVIKQFLAGQSDAQEIPIKADWGKAVSFGRQIFPDRDNMDGFYYAHLSKGK